MNTAPGMSRGAVVIQGSVFQSRNEDEQQSLQMQLQQGSGKQVQAALTTQGKSVLRSFRRHSQT